MASEVFFFLLEQKMMKGVGYLTRRHVTRESAEAHRLESARIAPHLGSD